MICSIRVPRCTHWARSYVESFVGFAHARSIRRTRSQWSYLRLSQTIGYAHKDFRAVCKYHDCCTKSKSGRIGRPIGSLWAWLDGGATCLTALDHAAFIPPKADREIARTTVLLIDGSGDFFNAERLQKDGEDDEPDEFLG
jgi:hypothetical protein